MERPRTTRGNRTPEDQVAFDTFLNAFARLIGSTPTGVHIQISNATGEGIMGELKKLPLAIRQT